MDEPTTGLHLSGIERLMSIVEELASAGNSVVIIEHNLDVIRRGGQAVLQGTPEDAAACSVSLTGRYLTPLLCQ